MGKRVALFLAEGFEEVEAVTPVDFLRRAGVEVVITGIGGKEIPSCREMVIKADTTIEELEGPLDGVILPGGMPGASNIGANEKAVALIKEMNVQGKLVAAICASPAVILEKNGILEGKKATCFPSLWKDLKSGTLVKERVVQDGNILTSQGPGTAGEFSLKLAEILAGERAARDLFESTIQK